MGAVHGTVYERTPDGGIGDVIRGAEVTFHGEDSDVAKSVESGVKGSYAIDLPAGRYVASATHPGYEKFSTEPGFVVVESGGVQTFNVFMKASGRSRPSGPTVTDFSPVSGHGGTKLTIRGTGFSAVRDDNDVVVGGESARVIKASATELVVLVADNARTGPVSVTVAGKTGTGPQDFTVKPYPSSDSKEDGPPIYFAGKGRPGAGGGAAGAGSGSGAGGGLSPSGVTKVLVSLVEPSDLSPSDGAAARSDIVDKWDTVTTYFDQASFGEYEVQVTVTDNWNTLTGDEDTYVDYRDDPESDDEPWEPNIKKGGMIRSRLAAEAAQAAVDEGHSLDDFDAFVPTLFLDGDFIRAWNIGGKDNFSYSDSDTGTDIDISLSHEVNTMLLQETADWGRCAHELAHGLVNRPPSLDADGNRILDEDIYDSDLVDSSQASAEEFDLMGAHDTHPLFSAYFMIQLGWYDSDDTDHVRKVKWDKNATSNTYEVVAHGENLNTDSSQCHVVEIEVSSGLSYFVEVRQRPTGGTQVFDDQIPLDGAPNDGGIVVSKVLTDTVKSNQQMRFLTLLHDESDTHVLNEGDTAVDPARDLEIKVTTHGVETDPLVCEVTVEWAQNIEPDPESNFNLTIQPWNTDEWETPDIWIDRKPYGTFDKDRDPQGRPEGNGDKPLPLPEAKKAEKKDPEDAIHNFTARIENEGTEKATNVKVGYYTVDPPGVGDNDNWAPLKTVTIPQIDADDFVDKSVEWVPVVGDHTCLKVEIAEQMGEKAFGKNSAQENIFDFEAPASSTPSVVTMETAVRNPLDRETIVYLEVRNVPAGYVVHFPHQWVWLDAKEEQTYEMTVVPTEEYSWFRDVHREDPTARIRLDGAIARHYTESVPPGTEPPSILDPIGGVTMNVTPKREVDLDLEVRERDGSTVTLEGTMAPALEDEAVSVAVRNPRDRVRVAETVTDADGLFEVTMDMSESGPERGDEEPPFEFVPGIYRGQARTISAPRAAETESTVVHFELSREVEADWSRVSPPADMLGVLDNFVTPTADIPLGGFTRFTGLTSTSSVRAPSPEPPSQPPRQDLQPALSIATLHVDTEADDYQKLTDEYIEFANSGDASIDLTGWVVEDEAGHKYVFPKGATLEPNETVRVRTGSGTDTESDRYWGASGPVWNNTADTVFLYDNERNLILEESYGSD